MISHFTDCGWAKSRRVEDKMDLSKLINVPSVMRTKHEEVNGVIKYGVRDPIAPGTEPLMECNPESKEKISVSGGKKTKPRFWFVDYSQGIKVRLLTSRTPEEGVIMGIGKGVEIFAYTINFGYGITV